MPFFVALEPGALGRFLGLLLGIVYAAFAICGMEIVTLLVIEVCSSKSFLISTSTSAVAETRNPRKNMIAAMRTVFFRIFVCYVGPAYIARLILLKLVL